MWDDIVSLLFVLLATCVMLVLAYCFTRYVVGRMVPGGSWRSGHITILEQVAISREQKLLLVQMGEHVYFLGVAQGSITCLQEVPPEEVTKWQEQRMQAAPQMPTMSAFQEVYRKMMQQRKK